MKFKMPWNEQIFFCCGTSRSDKSECTAWAHTALNTNILCFTASFRSTINCQNRTHNNFLMLKSTVHSNLCRGLHNNNIFFLYLFSSTQFLEIELWKRIGIWLEKFQFQPNCLFIFRWCTIGRQTFWTTRRDCLKSYTFRIRHCKLIRTITFYANWMGPWSLELYLLCARFQFTFVSRFSVDFSHNLLTLFQNYT